MSKPAVEDLTVVAAMQEATGVLSKTEARLEVCSAILQAALESPVRQVTAFTVRRYILSDDLTHRVGATFAALRLRDVIVTVPGAVALSGNAGSRNRQRLMPVYDVNVGALADYIDDLEAGDLQ